MPAATKLVDLPRVRALARLFRHGDVKPESPGGGGAAPGSRTDNRRSKMVRSGPVMHTLLPDVCLWECVDPRWAKGGATAVKFRRGRISDRRPRRSGQAGHVALGATNTGLQGGVLGRSSATLRTF